MNIKKKSSHQERSSRRSTASRADCFLVGVGDLADGELARRLLQRLSGGVEGQVVRRPRCVELPRVSNRPVALNRRFGVLTRRRRSEARRRLSKPGWSSSVPGLSLGL